MFLYLLYLSIKRSLMLSKSAFVVMTDSSISLGWKIHKLSEVSKFKSDIERVSETFEENLFEESRLWKSKKKLWKEVMDKLFWGYEKIFTGTSKFWWFGRNSDDIRVVLLLIWLYTAYVAIMASVYFFWVLGLLIFGKILIWTNTKYLIYRGHSVLKINNLFGSLDRDSEGIKDEKRNLSSLLKEAHNNNWQEGLLLKINDGITSINTYASDLINTRNDIEEEIQKTKKTDLKSVLKLSLERVNMQLLDIDKFIPILEVSISKLQK